MYNDLTDRIDKKYRSLQNDPPRAVVEAINPFESVSVDKKLNFILTVLYATIEALNDSQRQVFYGELKKAGIEV